MAATAPAPPSLCGPARGGAGPQSRGASVSRVALGDAGDRGPGEVTGGARAAAAAREDAARSVGQVTGSCPRNGGRAARAEGGKRGGLGMGPGTAGSLPRELDRNRGERKRARPRQRLGPRPEGRTVAEAGTRGPGAGRRVKLWKDFGAQTPRAALSSVD